MQIAAVVLAAGASTRFGSPKQHAPFGGRTMLGTVLRTAREAGLRPIIAVVPADTALPAGVVPVENGAPEAGMSRSLRLGIGAVPPECDGALVLLGDQPTVRIEAIRAVLDAASGGGSLVAARAEGRLAPPVLLMRGAFGLVETAVGDAGLRDLLSTRPELVTAVEVGEHAPDVDTPSDLARIAHMFDSAPDR